MPVFDYDALALYGRNYYGDYDYLLDWFYDDDNDYCYVNGRKGRNEQITFVRPDGSEEGKDIRWCVDNDMEEIMEGLWSGPWYWRGKEQSSEDFAATEDNMEPEETNIVQATTKQSDSKIQTGQTSIQQFFARKEKQAALIPAKKKSQRLMPDCVCGKKAARKCAHQRCGICCPGNCDRHSKQHEKKKTRIGDGHPTNQAKKRKLHHNDSSLIF